MKRYEAIESAVQKRDVKALREAMGSLCYTSRDFSSGEFDEYVRYIEAKGIILKDDHLVGPPTVSSQKESFTDEDFAKAIFELKRNFCDERIQDVKKIGKSLYGRSGREENRPQLSEPSPKSTAGGTSPNGLGHQLGALLAALVLVAVIVVLVVVVRKAN